MNSTLFIILTIICATIVIATAFSRLVLRGGYKLYLISFVIIFLASWLAENTCIHFYHFYSYHEGWPFFIDKLPVIIMLIWPLVILSAKDLAHNLANNRKQFILIGTIIVFFDASFIEPVSATIHLWTWTVPGFFGVPIIGVMGWAIFAAFSFWLLPSDEKEATFWRWIALLFVPAIGTHLVLIILWWGLMRWISMEISDTITLIVATISSALLVIYLLSKDLSKVPPSNVILRIPAALFFFFLFALRWKDVPLSLLAFMFIFSIPWVVLLGRSFWKTEH